MDHTTMDPNNPNPGYAREADVLVDTWETVSFVELHQPVLHLIPAGPCSILDIGAGSGRDAGHLAAMGHHVVAVEPVDELRTAAMTRHPSPRIAWIDDGLPELATLSRNETFDLVMLTAVWMHLDPQQRPPAMARLASLLRTGGLIIMSLRHGPMPAGRRMFDVGVEETLTLAGAQQLRAVFRMRAASMQPANRRAGVTWTRLALIKSNSPVSSVP
ncbi:class I SAM-dependent methyltransferase [Bradyrhizobium sp. LHD-71]|uniref:class I SAM-dependent methyltransferase n=1 Tax=Bradyrhizobium sp. LHD-71 TaxID=3072141 RepID=UPI00280CD7F8|nr:class I SAM-dependent methyltransferase [Bradyrhizobium sp. LHD-71]MDQ8731504.1 class I SAM-dependent methyltransferase [Bradyrhizobium sp. LHD-71]